MSQSPRWGLCVPTRNIGVHAVIITQFETPLSSEYQSQSGSEWIVTPSTLTQTLRQHFFKCIFYSAFSSIHYHPLTSNYMEIKMFVKTLLDRLTLEPEIRLQVCSFRAFNYYGWSQRGHNCRIKKKQSVNSQDVGVPTGPDWALSMAKLAGAHSAAQWTTATFPHLICKAIPLPSHSVHSVHLFVISMSRLHLFCPLRRQRGEEWRDVRNQVSRRLLCNQRASSHGASLHPLPPNPLSQHTFTSPPPD